MQKEWINRFWNCLQIIKQKKDSVTLEEKHSIKESLSKLAKEIAKNAKLDINVPEKNALLWDIVRTEESLLEHFYSEQTAALYSSLNNDFEMTQMDCTLLSDGYTQLFEKVKYQLSLSGHTHTFNYGGESFAQIEEDKIIMENAPFVVGDRMLNKDSFFAGLITIDRDKKSIHWQMKASTSYPKSIPEKTWNY